MKAIETTVDLDLAQAEEAVRQALAEQGFGILTEIDVAATLKNKLGVDRPPLKILGACNPGFADQALGIDPAASLLIPCNVAIRPGDSGGTHIAIVDPRELMPDPAMSDLAADASAKLATALDSLHH